MWSDFSGYVGWTGWLLVGLAMIAFWGGVIVALCALFQIPWPADRRHRSAPRGDFVPRDAARREPRARGAVSTTSKATSRESRGQPTTWR